MAKKIVLKVSIVCDKCKTCIMKTVAKVCGIKSLDLDGEKGTLTVIGDVDVVLIVKALRKAGKAAEIVSVGPEKEEKKEEKEEEKKKEEKKDDKCKELPPCCPACRPVSFGTVVLYEEEQPFGCAIL
ncbi:heavy metal-associated isoprenylated plant protein 39-like [Ananas comosus]|uniref:Heavy metal-associated isoprenylated plant protein 39-like n=1 Tax=Ananas comosus TaxID=4615 RepID=A0A6P5GLR8_ANACO|nr:heavy metal-associated isoprenylated plant protein 39-like [Ananas comosus]